MPQPPCEPARIPHVWKEKPPPHPADGLIEVEIGKYSTGLENPRDFPQPQNRIGGVPQAITHRNDVHAAVFNAQMQHVTTSQEEFALSARPSSGFSKHLQAEVKA